jgi:hypothetical protein
MVGDVLFRRLASAVRHVDGGDLERCPLRVLAFQM